MRTFFSLHRYAGPRARYRCARFRRRLRVRAFQQRLLPLSALFVLLASRLTNARLIPT
jgi:hypothetical protein